MNDAILSRVPGAVAYFAFAANGKLIDSVTRDPGRLDEGTLDLLGHVCVANRAIANMEARGWEGISDVTGFYPVEGFVYVGVNLSVVSHGDRAFVLDNEEADYEAAHKVLVELEK